jgi:hypothetical protein
MANKHIVELLIEANKKISEISNKVENENSVNRQKIIDEINIVIRQLDHVVEQLGESN